MFGTPTVAQVQAMRRSALLVRNTAWQPRVCVLPTLHALSSRSFHPELATKWGNS